MNNSRSFSLTKNLSWMLLVLRFMLRCEEEVMLLRPKQQMQLRSQLRRYGRATILFLPSSSTNSTNISVAWDVWQYVVGRNRCGSCFCTSIRSSHLSNCEGPTE